MKEEDIEQLGRLVSQQIPALKTTDERMLSTNLFRDDATSERNLGLFSSMLEAHEGGTIAGEEEVIINHSGPENLKKSRQKTREIK